MTNSWKTLMWSLAAMVIAVPLGIWRISDWSGAAYLWGALAVIAYTSFIIIELSSSKSEESHGAELRDRNTFELYALARGVTLVSALTLAVTPESAAARVPIGLAIMVFGIGFRTIARWTLGQFYSHRVRIADDHQIVQTGPYRWVRHPAYSGMLAVHLGLVLVFFHWVAVVALLVLFVPAVVRRIQVEEVELHTLPGYSEFSANRSRLVPWVW